VHSQPEKTRNFLFEIRKKRENGEQTLWFTSLSSTRPNIYIKVAINTQTAGGWGAAIPEILEGFNDDYDEKYQGKGKLRGISVLVTDTPHLPQPP
jgi:hypothetical protein